MTLVFARLKEFITSKNKVYITNEERFKALNSSLNASASRLVISGVIVAAILISSTLFAIETSLSFNLVLLIGIIVSSVSSYLVSSYFWLLFEKRKDVKDRKFKPKKENPLFKEVEEKVFIGIND